MSPQLPEEIRARIDAHLEAVDRALIMAGHTRQQRTAVTDDLESQILEMIEFNGPNPTLADVEDILSHIDPPTAYASTNTLPTETASKMPDPPSPVNAQPRVIPRLSKTAKWGGICAVASVTLMVIMYAISGWMAHSASHEIHIMMDATSNSAADTSQDRIAAIMAWKYVGILAMLAGVALSLLSTVLGWVAFVQIRSSKGALSGTGIALCAGLTLPVVTIIMPLIGGILISLLL